MRITTYFTKKCFYALILTLLFVPFLISAETSEFSPEIDTWIREYSPTENFNYLDYMILGRTDWGKGTKADRSVLSFDLSLIPNNATIQSAILYLDFYSTSFPWEYSPLPNITAICYPITKFFGEGSFWTLAWLYYDWCGEDYCLWDNAGGDYNPTLTSAQTMPIEFGIVDWNIKEIVKNEILNGDKQLNILIKLAVETGENTWWNFRTTLATEGQKPKLIVNWTSEEEPSIIVPITPDLPINILAYSGQIFNDIKEIVFVIIGLPIGFFIIRKIIGLGL